MEFWNDYEGKTLAERFEIGKLLRSGGRSAQFHVADVKDGKRTDAVLRLTESLDGEHAMLDCWRKVQAANEPHLIRILETGETVFDGVPLTWALLEKHDMDLAEILGNRHLTAAEATDVARGLVAAVQALHAMGLVHDAITAEHVQAVGETVKLRSDIVRVCVEDQEFVSAEECAARRREDVVAVSATVLEAMTGRRDLTAAPPLPAPLDAVIRHGFDGSWTLDQMAASLNPPPAQVAPQIASAPVLEAPAAPVRPMQHARLPFPEQPAPQAPPSYARHTRSPEPVPTQRSRRRFHSEASLSDRLSPRLMAACAAVVFAILAIGWGLLHKHAPVQPEVAAVALPPAAPIAVPNQPAATTVPPPSPAPAPAAPSDEARPGARWRVVVYTYRHEEQALAMVSRLRERFGSMEPRVFKPQNGVYLVALGGPMNEEDAVALRDHARRRGLPRDTFIRNF